MDGPRATAMTSCGASERLLGIVAGFVAVGLGAAAWRSPAPSGPAGPATPPLHSRSDGDGPTLPAPRVWLVDGFNALHVGGAARPRAQRVVDRARAASSCSRRVRAFDDRAAEIWVVFDGRHPGEEPAEAHGRGPAVIFAPSADDWLLARVREAARRRVAVVTADRRLAARARDRGRAGGLAPGLPRALQRGGAAAQRVLAGEPRAAAPRGGAAAARRGPRAGSRRRAPPCGCASRCARSRCAASAPRSAARAAGSSPDRAAPREDVEARGGRGVRSRSASASAASSTMPPRAVLTRMAPGLHARRARAAPRRPRVSGAERDVEAHEVALGEQLVERAALPTPGTLARLRDQPSTRMPKPGARRARRPARSRRARRCRASRRAVAAEQQVRLPAALGRPARPRARSGPPRRRAAPRRAAARRRGRRWSRSARPACGRPGIPRARRGGEIDVVDAHRAARDRRAAAGSARAAPRRRGR